MVVFSICDEFYIWRHPSGCPFIKPIVYFNFCHQCQKFLIWYIFSNEYEYHYFLLSGWPKRRFDFMTWLQSQHSLQHYRHTVFFILVTFFWDNFPCSKGLYIGKQPQVKQLAEYRRKLNNIVQLIFN